MIIMEKKTPLYDAHVAAGGKMVPFAGYLMPIQYGTGIIAEHNAVRKQAGMFDVSHMAELELSGPDAAANVNNLITNDVAAMEVGQVAYTPFFTLLNFFAPIFCPTKVEIVILKL